MFSFFSCCAFAFVPHDPKYHLQYHLKNTGQFGGIPGEDLNVEPAWERGLTGNGIPIVVYGVGCRTTHKEIVDRIDINKCWNYEKNSSDPYDPNSTFPSLSHYGAGLAAASTNDICGVGVAPNATLGCVNVDSKKTPDLLEQMKSFPARVKNYIGSSMCTIKGSSSNFMCYSVNAQQLADSIIFNYFDTMMVTSGSGSGFINDDPAFQAIASSPFAFVFGEISQRGYRTTPSLESSVLLASVVVGGSTGQSMTSTFTKLIAPSSETDDKCGEGVTPASQGSAIGSGALAIILESNPDLKIDDLQTIIALTSIKNDPKSTTWTRNSAGYMFSRYYGFGRLDVDRASKLASNWTKLPTIQSSTITADKKPFVPTFMGDPIEFTMEEQHIKYVQSLSLLIYFSSKDYGNIKVWLTSPSGTKMLLKLHQVIVDNDLPFYRIASRQFFGENGVGTWKVTIQRTGFGPQLQIKLCQLQTYGYLTTISLPIVPEINGSDPFTPYKRNENISISTSQTEYQCGTTMLFPLSVPDSNNKTIFDFVAKGEATSETILAGNGQGKLAAINIPCVYASQKIQINVQSPFDGISSNVLEMHYVNNKTKGFNTPEVYQTFEYPQDKELMLDINVDISHQYRQMNGYISSLFAVYTIIDSNATQYYYKTGSFPKDVLHVSNSGKSCQQCMLVVTPMKVNLSDKCDSFIIPISLIQNGEKKPDPWTLKWQSSCPPQPGILPDPTHTPTSTSTFTQARTPKEMSKDAVISLSVCVPIIIILIAIIICLVLFRRPNNASNELLIKPTLI